MLQWDLAVFATVNHKDFSFIIQEYEMLLGDLYKTVPNMDRNIDPL
jgi:hypothetical protein